MRFQLTIDTHNEALTGDYAGSELARIMRKLAARLDEDSALLPTQSDGRLLDVNGATVGSWTLEVDPANTDDDDDDTDDDTDDDDTDAEWLKYYGGTGGSGI